MFVFVVSWLAVSGFCVCLLYKCSVRVCGKLTGNQWFLCLCRCAAFNSCTCLCGCTAWKHTHVHTYANTHTTSWTGRGGLWTLFSYKLLPFWFEAHMLIGDSSNKSNATVSHMAHFNCCFVLHVYVLWRHFLTTATSEQGIFRLKSRDSTNFDTIAVSFSLFFKDQD